MEDHIVLPVLMVGNIYLLGYMVFCLKLVNRYQSLIKHNYSTFTEHDFSWIKNLLIGSMAVISIDLFTGLYYFITEKELVILGSSDGHLTILAMVILVAYLGYHGVGQSRMLLPEFLLAQNEEPLEKMVKEEKKSNTHPLLSDEELKNLEGRFHTVLVEQKLYLDENLTLGKIASLMDTTDKKLSFFINHHLHTTFYDLINKERVAMVKTQLHEKALQQYTLLGIAHNSGFKSKTSFNRIFKKETGLSPSEYVKQFKLKH
jgi:AraC-like DNA-binding protein